MQAHYKPPSKLQQLQYQFAAHLRSPNENPAPSDIEDRRMRVYRALFYNNIENFIRTGFPVLNSILNKKAWHSMVRDFFARHQSRSPYFLEIGKEFLDYLQMERNAEEDPPFMKELAWYEWLELFLHTANIEMPEAGFDPEGDLLDGVPVVSPLVSLQTFQYPVHRIKQDFQPQSPPEKPTYLVVYRNLKDQVKFMELNAVSARLLTLLMGNVDSTGEQLLKKIARELNHPDVNAVLDFGGDILARLFKKNIILGVAFLVRNTQ